MRPLEKKKEALGGSRAGLSRTPIPSA